MYHITVKSKVIISREAFKQQKQNSLPMCITITTCDHSVNSTHPLPYSKDIFVAKDTAVYSRDHLQGKQTMNNTPVKASCARSFIIVALEEVYYLFISYPVLCGSFLITPSDKKPQLSSSCFT